MDQHLLEALHTKGIEHFKRFYSAYRGIVTRNDDPDKRGRIQAFCPTVGHSEAPNVWIDCAIPGAGTDRGMLWVPEVGDGVFVFFENGEAGKPRAYVGGWYAQGEVPKELGYGKKYPERRGFVTRMGHSVVFDDTSGEESLTITWHKAAAGDKALTDRKASADRGAGASASMTFTKDGAINLKDSNGSMVRMDTIGKKVEVQFQNDSKVTLRQGEVVVDAKRINHGAKAQEAHVKGSTYRHQQATMNATMRTNFQTIGTMCTSIGTLLNTAGANPALAVLAGATAAALVSAGAIFITMGSQFQSVASALSSFEGQSTTYLSGTTFTE